MFAWHTYYNLAVELAENFTQNMLEVEREARRRSAISRAYYAAFCTARNFAEDREGFRFATGSRTNHLQVWNHISKTTDIRRREIGTIGGRLLGTRVKADYHDEIPNLPVETRKALIEAAEILEYFRQLN